MKKITFLFILLFITILIKAQDYQISFTGSGQSTNVDSVFVENLTQGTTLVLLGSDILHLVGTLDIVDQSVTSNNLHIYPNPISETSKLSFYTEQADDVKIEIYDISGKLIALQSNKVQQGINVFEISGFTKGIYTANITTSAWQKSLGFISVNDKSHRVSITSVSDFMIEPQTKLLKSTKSLVQMQYNDGETLLFTVFADDYSRVITTVPTQTETINSEFVACTDLDGNNYAVVTIGNQTWMAENLKYLPSVVGPGTGSYTEAFYYVNAYDGTNVAAAKETENYNTYGVLYNWPAAMAGSASSSSNPSGVQGVCPTGWHLPSDVEWKVLEMELGMSEAEADNVGWRGTNEGSKIAGNASLWADGTLENDIEFGTSGFAGLPGGYRNWNGSTFYGLGESSMFWSATENDGPTAFIRSLGSDATRISRSGWETAKAFSVRCLKN